MTRVTDIVLADRWQKDFPLIAAPFAQIAGVEGMGEAQVIEAFARLLDEQVISRIGAVVRPNTVGASTLAAMRVPLRQLEDIAQIVSNEPGVNHNYEREHPFNLWFVVTGRDRTCVNATLASIESKTGFSCIDLPMVQAYYLDLGFPLTGEAPRQVMQAAGVQKIDNPLQIGEADVCLLCALENGLDLVPRPFDGVAEQVGRPLDEVLARLGQLQASGIIARFGCVIRHRAVGFAANAMAVWNVPDEDVDRIADIFIQHPMVTLCYRRPRRLPDWPYNLFCMIHAKERTDAISVRAELDARAGTGDLPRAVLFSRRCFKQRGARFSPVKREHVA